MRLYTCFLAAEQRWPQRDFMASSHVRSRRRPRRRRPALRCTALIGPEAMRWFLSLSCIGMSVGPLIRDRIRGGVAGRAALWRGRYDADRLFLREMGDKTRIATVALTAEYASLIAAITGTMFGMLLAIVPAVLLGGR